MDFKQRWPLENGRYVFDHIETLSGRSLRCSQCQEQDIKYVHHLRDLTTGEKIRVGCECAGRLLGDVAGARRRQLKHMRDDRPQKQKASVPGSKTHGRTSRSSPTERNARTRVCPGGAIHFDLPGPVRITIEKGADHQVALSIVAVVRVIVGQSGAGIWDAAA